MTLHFHKIYSLIDKSMNVCPFCDDHKTNLHKELISKTKMFAEYIILHRK